MTRIYARPKTGRRCGASASGNKAPSPLPHTAEATIRAILRPSRVQPKMVIGSPDDVYEHEADRVADRVMGSGGYVDTGNPIDGHSVTGKVETRRADPGRGESLQAKTGSAGAPQAVPAAEAGVHSMTSGLPLSSHLKDFFETRLDADLDRVRIHTDGNANRMAAGIGARAFTLGQDIGFGAGEYSPDTFAGRHLLAHELTHTLQQGGDVVRREPLEDEVKVELEAWAAENPDYRPIDPKNNGYAFSLQEFAFTKIYSGGFAKDKPKDKKAQAAWSTDFAKAHILAKMILAASDKVEQKYDRAGMIGDFLAQAGFVTEAMEIAAGVQEEQKEMIYTTLAKRWGSKLSRAQIVAISGFFVAKKVGIDDHPFLKALTDDTAKYTKALGKDKVLAIIESTLAAYKAQAAYLDTLARVLIIYTTIREDLSQWLWGQDKDYLFKILESEYFVEPGYDGTVFPDTQPLTMADDMPWVYKYKQKYYVRTPKKPITQILNFPAKLLLAKFPICARPVTASSCIPLAFQELVPGWPPAPRYPTSQAPLRVHRHADGSVRVSLAPHGSDLTFHPPLGWYWLNRSCNHFSQL